MSTIARDPDLRTPAGRAAWNLDLAGRYGEITANHAIHAAAGLTGQDATVIATVIDRLLDCINDLQQLRGRPRRGGDPVSDKRSPTAELDHLRVELTNRVRLHPPSSWSSRQLHAVIAILDLAHPPVEAQQVGRPKLRVVIGGAR